MGRTLLAWAAGLVVTTTGLPREVKLRVQQEVEAAGGRCGVAGHPAPPPASNEGR